MNPLKMSSKYLRHDLKEVRGVWLVAGSDSCNSQEEKAKRERGKCPQLEQAEPAMLKHGLWFSGMLLETQCPLFQLLMHILSHRKKSQCFSVKYSRCFSVNQKEEGQLRFVFVLVYVELELWDGNIYPQGHGGAQSCQRKGIYLSSQGCFVSTKGTPRGKGQLGWGISRTCNLLLCPGLTHVPKSIFECCKSLFTIR